MEYKNCWSCRKWRWLSGPEFARLLDKVRRPAGKWPCRILRFRICRRSKSPSTPWSLKTELERWRKEQRHKQRGLQRSSNVVPGCCPPGSAPAWSPASPLSRAARSWRAHSCGSWASWGPDRYRRWRSPECWTLESKICDAAPERTASRESGRSSSRRRPTCSCCGCSERETQFEIKDEMKCWN